MQEVKKFNGYEIPYSDKEFDMVYCSHVIEHVEHPRILLREIKRVSNFQVFEVPIDYSARAYWKHQNVEHFLSYGHINIYTPSLFKFLLRSEGYEIITELFTHTSEDVIRFNWYKNMNLKKSIYRELALKMYPLYNLLKRLKYGKKLYKEFGYSAYTCLAKGAGDLKIF